MQLLLALVLAAFSFIGGASAQVPSVDKWVVIGSFEADLAAGSAIGDLRAAKGSFKAVRLIVRDGELSLNNIQIRYSNGTAHNERRAIALVRGEQTRPIDQRDPDRFVESVVLCYPLGSGRAKIEVQGLQTAAGATAVRPPVTQALTWQPACPGASAVTATSASATIAQPPPAPPGTSPTFRPRGVNANDKAPPSQAKADPCADKCTPVQIFFGTDRKRDASTQLVKFGGDPVDKPQLGRAVVTVPKTAERRRGEIPLPNWIDRNILRVPPGGDPAKHFVIMQDGFKLYDSDAAFVAAVQEAVKNGGTYKDHAFIFVHGYNVAFEPALYRTAQIAYDLGDDDPAGRHVPFGTAFLYSWPSGGELLGYLKDSDRARNSAVHLKRFVELVAQQSGAKQLHLIAHSMGNLALLNALKDVAASPPGGAAISQVILAAPDVDRTEFDRLARAIVPMAKAVTLYASSKDFAMIAARKVRGNSPRAGDVDRNGPLVVPKVYSIDISALSTEYLSARHSEYADKKELIDDINRMLTKAEQPPYSRNTNFVRRARGADEYWQYSK